MNTPSSIHVSWHPKSPVQDVDKLKLMLSKIFANVTSIDVKGGRCTIRTTYTSANKTIEKKLVPFKGNVRWSRAGHLSEEQEKEVDDLFDLLTPVAGPSKSAKKRKVMDSSEDEEEVVVKAAKRKPSFKKRDDLDDFINDDDSE